MKPTFVIEHLEEDYYDWCRYEYTHAAMQLAPAKLMITNFAHSHELPENVSTTGEKAYDLLLADQDRVCLLDSESPTLLSPEDAVHFDFILLGGILGNGKA